MARLLIIAFFTAFLCSCSTSNSEVIETPKINLRLNNPARVAMLSEFAKGIEYIELESNFESFIGEISDIAFSDNYIIILDQKQKKVLLFNSTGKFIRQIGKHGKGPKEHGTIFSIDISDDENYVYLHTSGDYIKKYNLEGEVESSFATQMAKFQYFKCFEDDLLFVIPYPLTSYFDGYTFGIFNSKGEIKHKFLRRKHKTSDHTKMLVCNSSFYSIADTVVYWQYIYDTIYSITPDYKLVPRWTLNYEENRVPKDAFKTIESLNNSKRSGNFMITKIIESKFDIFFTAIANRKRHLLIFNKRHRKLFNLPPVNQSFYGLENNIDYGPSFWPEYLLNDSSMACVISPEKLINQRTTQKKDYESDSSEFKEIVNRASVNSNHVIMKIILK